MAGVVRTRVGYAGGKRPGPTYRSIGDHMESIQIDYDPGKLSYDDLLQAFLAGHNPRWRSPIRQYASAVFYHDEEQRSAAEKALAAWSGLTGHEPATLIVPYAGFTLAEDYHQKYYLKNTRSLMKEYASVYPDPDDQVNSTATARVNGYLGGAGTLAQLEEELPILGLSEAGRTLLLEHVRKYNQR